MRAKATRDRMRSIWATGLLASLLLCLASAATASAADRVYWARQGNVLFANFDGSGFAETLQAAMGTQDHASSTSFDPQTGRIYWTNLNGAKPIGFAGLDGSGGTLDVGLAGRFNPRGVAIDPIARRIYWANENAAGSTPISFASLDVPGLGGQLDTRGAPINNPEELVVDPVGRRIYSANIIGNAISFFGLDNPGDAGALNTGTATVAGPAGLAIDPIGRRIYWSNANANKISFANLDGSGGGDLNTAGADVELPGALVVDPLAGLVYWGNRPAGPLSFARLDGSGGGNLPRLESIEMLALAPRSTAPPSVAGGSAPGSVLSCSEGGWGRDFPESRLFEAPRSFAFQWTRNGAEIPGATGPTVGAAALGGAYRCRVTASNAFGATAATSAPHDIARVVFDADTGVRLTLAAQRIPARGPIPVRVANANPFAVAGTLSGGAATKVAAKGRRVKLPGSKFDAGAGRSVVVKLKLPAPLPRLLAAKGKLSLALHATVTDTLGDSRTVTARVTPKLKGAGRRPGVQRGGQRSPPAPARPPRRDRRRG